MWFKWIGSIKVLFFYYSNGKLMAIGDRIGLPDDVSVGYIIGMNHALYFWNNLEFTALYGCNYIIINYVFNFVEHLLKIQLTRVEQFHSHLEPMRLIKKDQFSEQVIRKHK